MALPFLKSFKKSIEKLETVGVGIRTITEWLSTGNYALNRSLSGDFSRGVPLGKLTLFAGPSGCLPRDEVIEVYEFQTDPALNPEILYEEKT